MISACKSMIRAAYVQIGESQEDQACQIVERLKACPIRNSCPYCRVCARTVETLRRDIKAGGNGVSVLGGTMPATGDEVLA